MLLLPPFCLTPVFGSCFIAGKTKERSGIRLQSLFDLGDFTSRYFQVYIVIYWRQLIDVLVFSQIIESKACLPSIHQKSSRRSHVYDY